MPTGTLTILIAAGSVFAVASLIYGLIRRFTRMSWLSYQIPLVFLIVALVRLLPAGMSPLLRLLLGVGILVGATALVVGGGALLRGAMLRKRLPAHPAWKFLDHFLGAVTAFWDYIVILFVLGCTAFSFFAYVYDPIPAVTEVIFSLGIWKNFLAHHALDLLLVTVFVYALRGGWRVGFGRVIVILLMLALSVGCIALGIYLAAGVPFFAKIGTKLMASSGLSPAISKLVGTAIVAFVLFLIFFIVCCVGGFFAVKLMRRIRFDYFWGTIDGFLGCVLLFAVAFALIIGLNIAAGALASGVLSDLVRTAVEGLGENGASLQPVLDFVTALEGQMQGVAAWLQSAPLASAIYQNPFLTFPVSPAA